MPRPLVFGNGSLLIGIDEHYTIRDLFYPQVGLHNHLSGHWIRMGVWVDGQFSWCDTDVWKRTMAYEPGTLVGNTSLINADHGLRLRIVEGAHPKSAAFVRQMTVENLTDRPRDVRIFFTHDLRIAATDIGDTAFYNPYLDAVIHYKGPHYVLFGGRTSLGGIKQYATGIKGFAGLEGTWRDAEDGHLSQNPIAQGSVDSTMGLHLRIGPKESTEALYWILCGHRLEDVTALYHELTESGWDAMLEETKRFWFAWSNRKQPGMDSLPAEVVDLYTQSLLIMRTQIDNGGAVIAANDTDIMKTNRATYSYMWPRDGALVSQVMDRAGYQQLGRRFFQFCRAVLPPDRPILMHKYGPDGSLGASWHPWVIEGHPEVPFQEDETALTIRALWAHYERHQDLEFLGDMFDSFVVPTCEFMADYRDPSTGLPLPSWDLWEERRGIHTFTVAAVASAMRAASQIAEAVGDERSTRFRTVAAELTDALGTRMVDPETGAFWRMLHRDPRGGLHPDRTVDSSVLGAVLMDVFPASDECVKRTVERVENALTVHSKIGGVARYEGDYYFRKSDRYPGNPWLICSLWMAQAKMRLDPSGRGLEEGMRWLRWACARAENTGVMAEQYDPETGDALSVSPLTWSHAEYVLTVMEYLDHSRALGTMQ